ncbi:group 10 secretory phospholipase A2 [Protopterus annectens]|uniref:group 10 secretory phospholipase A2 n=1 Tax=Protopterus annectens TaxID=7888 RepID=UPI001CFAC305|nr:group 10 secretory phospholipase A2 [Protopterus annectens]
MEPAVRMLLLLLFTVYSSALEKSHSVHKRSILNLAGVIQCRTGHSALAYVSYGCYCGLGGNGWPRDKIDWCCHKHDCCYDRAESLGCKPKSKSYAWTCKNNIAKCTSMNSLCKRLSCKCDTELAKCFSQAPFRRKYVFWPKIMCGDDFPTCSIY